MKDIPTHLLENYWADNRVNGTLRFWLHGITFTIEQVRQELAERRKDDN